MVQLLWILTAGTSNLFGCFWQMLENRAQAFWQILTVLLHHLHMDSFSSASIVPVQLNFDSFLLSFLSVMFCPGREVCCYSSEFVGPGLHWPLSVSSVVQSCPTLCHPMNRSTPGFPVHHQLPQFTHTHVHRVDDAIQPSHPLPSPSPPALDLSQHQGLFQWVSSSHQVAPLDLIDFHFLSFALRVRKSLPIQLISKVGPLEFL